MDTTAFTQAAERVKQLKNRPSDGELLQLYGLFKQATAGDVSGDKPGLFDLKGRKKFEAWAKLKGTGKDQAAADYIKLVDGLQKSQA